MIDRLDEIAAAWDAVTPDDETYAHGSHDIPEPYDDAAEHVRWLVAEVRRLRAVEVAAMLPRANY
jgi:hypothetical protein